MASPEESGGPGRARAPPRRFSLRGEQETLVIPLYAKALDYRSRHSVLHDAKANAVVEAIDYDFDRLRSPGSPSVLAARARQFDDWVREFLQRHPDAVVLNVGCGLDARRSRVGPAASVLWIDLDLPSVIEFRRNFFVEGPGYSMVGASLTSPEWLTGIPRDRPAIAVADGVFEYLEPDDVHALLDRLTSSFPQGQLVFDVMNSFALRTGNARLEGRSEARLRWAVDNLSDVPRYAPRLRLVTAMPLLRSKYLPWKYRLLYGLSTLSSRMRDAIRVVRYEF